jgi:formamidopyrimidine-DNA glycosylase
VRRIGKRIVWEFGDGLFLVFHLMIAGRFRWTAAGALVPGRVGLAAFDFPSGTIVMTEAGSKRRASLTAVGSAEELQALDPGGLEVLDASEAEFVEALRWENHTLKRALTDPRIFSGIGNAYSDEILHAARLSPFKQTGQIDDDEAGRLYEAARRVLREWIERLQAESRGAFPDRVTAFHKQMAVHGKFGKPCPRCGTPVQRIVYADNEANYCPECQTGGKLLADRSLSRLLRDDWPRTLEELENRRRQGRTQ